ncbi:unnamed protein product [Ranitomeya imitator]|uniref:Uncharacterized protein n=1 Tax=Ranitomeya imitator TaxID=111125 RepID=A0ABN9MK61_9NEOB|nr:unnamed protein product [Ranitomeya imitator]
MIWNGGETSLTRFMQELNNNTFNLRFTYTGHANKIDFLDITLYVAEDGSIEMDLFRKETSVNSLLHAYSAHNYSVIKAIPVGQFLRNRWVCSMEARFERQSAILTEQFKARADNESGVRFISTSNFHWGRIQKILNKHWSILQTDSVLASQLTKSPLMIQGRGKNLKDNLVRSHYVAKNKNFFNVGSPRQGCFPCGSCVACSNILRCGTFKTSDGNREFISCNTNICDILYHIELKVRTREHVRDILAAKEATGLSSLKTLPRHFRTYHGSKPSGLKVRGIDKIHGGIRGDNIAKILAQRECKWIVILDTLATKGLIEKLSFDPFL